MKYYTKKKNLKDCSQEMLTGFTCVFKKQMKEFKKFQEKIEGYQANWDVQKLFSGVYTTRKGLEKTKEYLANVDADEELPMIKIGQQGVTKQMERAGVDPHVNRSTAGTQVAASPCHVISAPSSQL